jgi:hypothetical protein
MQCPQAQLVTRVPAIGVPGERRKQIEKRLTKGEMQGARLWLRK